MAEVTALVRIEIVHAEPQRAIVKALSLPQGARVADALELAVEDDRFSGIDFGCAALGIHGQVVQRDQLLRDGDRIEIYRPLAQDPKAARRTRAGRDRR